MLKKVSVDIVCDGGDCWVKVVARNPRALDLNSQVRLTSTERETFGTGKCMLYGSDVVCGSALVVLVIRILD